MLEYSITADGHYCVLEYMLSFTNTEIKIVTYKKDLSEKRINNERWIPMSKDDKKWFLKYCKPHFNKI